MKKWLHVIKGAVALLMVCLLSTQVYAGSMEDAQQDKEDAENKKEDAESILAGLESKKSDIEAWITELDTQLADIQADITDLNNQKADLEVQITKKQEELVVAKEKEQQQYADMCSRIQFMYENDGANYADALLNSQSMSDILNQPEYVSAMADYDYKMLEQLVATREQIANDEQLLQMDLTAVEQLTEQAQEKEATVNTLIDEKAQEVAEYEDLISRQEQLIAQYDAEVQAAATRIAELERAAQNNSEFVPYSGGALLWPCPSSTRITSYFGYRTPDGGYVNANHKGIDIGAPTGTPAVAAASGVVVIARYSVSAGNWVVISHGNGLYTIYMHASSLCVTEGQYVNAGDTILLIGSTGWSTGPHLHFGVGVGGYTSAYNVDPLQYY
ncbi:MAG: peptidoglycan DD-metalloendopeptidase family protein [Lachnospiraceae bacterium]|nr:peptidoglycan DD-metalloendopeptidase family protein [Lachnospiraceae bacterium]